MGDPISIDRYARHTILSELGEDGQRLLEQSAVLIVGCGALGSMIAQVLVRAGVGLVRIADRDLPVEHNLHRQILFDEPDVRRAQPKALLACEKLRRVNSGVHVEGLDVTVDGHNIESLLDSMDLVLDATDNFETRYVINDACIKHQKPWIFGGVLGTLGMTFNILPDQGPCFRCFRPEPPPKELRPTGETVGILSTAPWTIALHQATEAMKILVRSPEVSRDLTMIDIWHNHWQRSAVVKNRNCLCCVLRRFEFLTASQS